jgi:GDP-4-dehydro-6-deoxy-D-mannose reductase
MLSRPARLRSKTAVALITGAAGFCGQHLARHLANAEDAPMRLVGVGMRRDCPSDAQLDDYISTDLTQSEAASTLLKNLQPDEVFHLAGVSSGAITELYRINVLSSLLMLQAVHEYVPACRVLFVGSAAEYGSWSQAEMPLSEDHNCHPHTSYGISKYSMTLASLEYAMRARVRLVIMRPFNIVGAGVPSSLVIGALLERLRNAMSEPGELVVPIGNLDTQRDFIAVQDVVRGYVAAIRGRHWGEVFNLCSGRPRSIRSVAEELASYCGRPMRLRVKSELVRPDDVPVTYGSWEKAKRHFGFAPVTPLSSALRSAFEHAMRNPVS